MEQRDVPPWASTMARHGEPDQWDTGVVRYPERESREWKSPGPPPGAEGWISTARSHRNDQQPARLMIYIGISLVVTAILIIAIASVVVFSGKDSGVAACEAIASGKAADGSATTAGAKMTEREYQRGREQFAQSSDVAIRQHGTTLFDLAWQVQASPDTAPMLAAPMTEAYTGLAGACAAHGHIIPPLGKR